MRKLKRERGAITIITIISILFMVSFLISSYLIISNKVKTQKNIIAQMRSIYDQTESMDNMYYSFFGKNVVPIYTVDQLLAMGTGKRINVNGKYYDFSKTKETIYTLMNDLSFNVADYAEELNGYWLPIGERTEQNTDGFEANFEGNTYSIKVSGYIDDDGDKYEVEYSKANEFKEPIYNVKVTPVFEGGTIASDAMVLVGDETTTIEKGTRTISVKRLSNPIKVKVYLEGFEGESVEIFIDNPNKIKDMNLVLRNMYKDLAITITPVPSDATVVIASNGVEIARGQGVQVITVQENTNIDWTVSRTYYQTQTGNKTVTAAENIAINLEQNPVQGPITLSRTGISTKGTITTSNNANDDTDSITYANSFEENSSIIWNFSLPQGLNPNARIASVEAKCKLGASKADCDSTIVIYGTNASSTTQIFQTTQDKLSTLILGKVYTIAHELDISELVTISDVSSGLHIESRKNYGSHAMRWYGAEFTMTYVNP